MSKVQVTINDAIVKEENMINVQLEFRLGIKDLEILKTVFDVIKINKKKFFFSFFFRVLKMTAKSCIN